MIVVNLFLAYAVLFIIGLILLGLAVYYLDAKSSKQKDRVKRVRLSKPKYGIDSVTQNGEEVKSSAECKIADYFRRTNIKYVYEKPVRKRGFGNNYIIGRPDFYLPEFDVYVEYWGLVNAENDFTRRNYVKHMKIKMARYYGNGIKFISIYPHNMDNLDWVFRKKFEKVVGHQIPN